ncbi:MAG TPA: chloride channel protein [Micromonosporaceae bacterium]|jgi:H+/Cl- antiporter ClcA
MPVSPKPPQTRPDLGDFAVTPRLLTITALAVPVGVASALASYGLLRLIGLITNLVFYQRAATSLTAPGARHHPWWLVLGAPIVGGLIVGVTARFGSEKIRGHGMPEAIEAILTGGSRVAPRVAVLKPISAAVSIGTGGPFGAEGPIIMTGGAIGSILAQALRLTADERKTLLVAGAAGGMAATFNSPLAAILLAVELLLFEWRPRSFVPVAATVTTATIFRGILLGSAPIFPVATGNHTASPGVDALCLIAGLTGGALAVAATWLVYRAEDAFARLPVHWMWWPAIGGAIIGLGGLAEPRALGVGYDVIDQLLTGRAALSLIVGILVVKTAIWSLSLGSGTSGGVLAPVFMIGGALGALEGRMLPVVFAGFWAMMGLAAVVGGVMRSPLTGIVFTLELTHAWSALVPLTIAATSAYALSVLVLKRSVLTEKIARRGLHLSREYSVDPLEAFFVRDVSRPCPSGHSGETVAQMRPRMIESESEAAVTDPGSGWLVGVVTASALAAADPADRLAAIMQPGPAVVHDDDTLRTAAYVLAERHDTQILVVSRASRRPHGVITVADLLAARRHDLTEEHHRERHLPAAHSPLGRAIRRPRRRGVETSPRR